MLFRMKLSTGEFLEKQQNEKLTKAVFYGKFNSRGARIVQDGRNLYEQAKVLPSAGAGTEIEVSTECKDSPTAS